MTRQLGIAALLCWGLGFAAASSADMAARQAPAPPSGPVTIKQALDFAASNYPAIRASLAEVSAAQSGVELARTAYLPRTDLYWQLNRATRNNVFGLIFPNGVIPAISGPVQDESTITSTFGSAAGALFSWEPFDFGLRKANVELADALRRKAQAGLAVSEFEVSMAVVNAFFSALAGGEVVKAAQANVDRMQIFSDAVAVLVRNELRPGADESRARAEMAQARTELIRAEQDEKSARATLAEWLGLAGHEIQVEPARLLESPPAAAGADASLEGHPLARAQSAEVDVVRARRRSLEKSYKPRFDLHSAVFARGTGARIDGTFEGGAHGLAPSEGNWAVGMSVRFPIFEFKENRVRREIEGHQERTESARYDTVVQRLRGQVKRARLEVEAARRIAENTPVELEAARMLEGQARARYRAGLGTVVEVADAQRLLREAEIRDGLARLAIWKAVFDLAAAQGDMTAVLNQSSP